MNDKQHEETEDGGFDYPDILVIAALKADRKRILQRVVELENLVERFKTMYDLINQDGIQNDILNALFDPDSETALEQWGEWRCLMDSDVGVMAQYNRVGMYASLPPEEEASGGAGSGAKDVV